MGSMEGYLEDTSVFIWSSTFGTGFREVYTGREEEIDGNADDGGREWFGRWESSLIRSCRSLELKDLGYFCNGYYGREGDREHFDTGYEGHDLGAGFLYGRGLFWRVL